MEQPRPDVSISNYLDVVLRRRWVVAAVTVAVFASALLYGFLTKPVYQASALLIIEKERGGSGIYAGGTLVESSNDDYYHTQYKLLQSYSLLNKVYQELGLERHDDFSGPNGMERLQAALTVAPVARSRLVYVRIRSHDTAMAAQIANRISETFVEQNLANQLFISKEVLSALQLDGRGPDARKVYEGLPAVVSNSLIQSLKGEYAKLESQYAEMSQRFTDKYPAMAALKSNIASLRRQIDSETDKIVQSMKTELSGQLKGNNVRVVDPALVPTKPIKPKRLATALFGLAAGLALGMCLAFAIEIMDDSIRTQDDVETKLQVPYLGLIPQTRRNPEPVYEALTAKEPSLTSEAFRNLRTMLDFAQVAQKTKTMLVTSSVQSEGKTYLASNLGVVFAQLGESVLLIDGDLRRPKVHKNFGISNETGLSSFLASGQDVSELSRLIKPTVVDGLSVLPCGPRPPNPSELLNTPRLAAMLAWARDHYDRVLVDCTPMFPINDTILWGRHISNCMFVVRFGHTRVPLIRTSVQKLQAGGIKVLGAAVNSARSDGLTYSSYGYYYEQYYQAAEEPDVAATKA